MRARAIADVSGLGQLDALAIGTRPAPCHVELGPSRTPTARTSTTTWRFYSTAYTQLKNLIDKSLIERRALCVAAAAGVPYAPDFDDADSALANLGDFLLQREFGLLQDDDDGVITDGWRVNGAPSQAQSHWQAPEGDCTPRLHDAARRPSARPAPRCASSSSSTTAAPRLALGTRDARAALGPVLRLKNPPIGHFGRNPRIHQALRRVRSHLVSSEQHRYHE